MHGNNLVCDIICVYQPPPPHPTPPGLVNAVGVGWVDMAACWSVGWGRMWPGCGKWPSSTPSCPSSPRACPMGRVTPDTVCDPPKHMKYRLHMHKSTYLIVTHTYTHTYALAQRDKNLLTVCLVPTEDVSDSISVSNCQIQENVVSRQYSASVNVICLYNIHNVWRFL